MPEPEKLEEEIEMSPEQKAQYRAMLAASLRSAKKYAGDEQSFNLLIHTGNQLDQWMRETFGKAGKIDAAIETQVAAKAEVSRAGTINDILDLASKSFRNAMENPKTLGEKLQKLSIVHNTVDDVLLPPGAQPVTLGDGVSEWKEPLFEPRTERLIEALHANGIYTDDLIVTTGNVTDSMMRKASYSLIEIPRIGKEVLVCDQVGEATFVSSKHIGLPAYLSTEKEDLLGLPGVTRIVSRGLGKWEADVIAELLKDVSAGETKKIDVKNVEEVRRAILEKYPTGKEWMEMTLKQKETIRISGCGLRAIATKLGLHLERSPCDYLYEHALLGQVVYG